MRLYYGFTILNIIVVSVYMLIYGWQSPIRFSNIKDLIQPGLIVWIWMNSIEILYAFSQILHVMKQATAGQV